MAPAGSAPAVAPMAAPESPPIRMRAPNWIGTLRLGVFGSLSEMNSKTAAAVAMPTASVEPRTASGVPVNSSRPRKAAQQTAAGAVVARSPATTPISSAARKRVMERLPVLERTCGPS